MTAIDAPARPVVARQLGPDDVWREVEKASFAVLAHVAPGGEPRCTGVVYATVGRRLFVTVAPESRKAREIADGARVSLTVTVRRGGLLSLLFPIPPATISFPARVIVHAPGSLDLAAVSPALLKLIPPSRRERAVVLELVPEGQFLTYGIGVSLKDMANPDLAIARVPVA
jgi:hypothetical protein